MSFLQLATVYVSLGAFAKLSSQFPELSSKPCRLISLRKLKGQLLWNDILAKKPGGGGCPQLKL
ncbi:MAG: hypothetical protein DMG32_00680 [Acidobacteria bacterium]|nr:MAG: hypothetical protein DMG32_00680 [Acidobacteriota bacterium]